MDINDKNNKRLLITLFILFVLVIILTCIISTYLADKYKTNLLYFSNIVINNVEENYSDSTEQIINNIFNENVKIDKSVLDKYGISQDTIDINNNMFNYTKTLNTILFIFIISLFVVIFICVIYYMVKQNKKLSKLNNYTEEVLNNNYMLDIRDNDEGNISKLKNKIYDMTVMLKEKNFLLEQDKIKIEKMIADISHQIKTPLTSLNILTELLYEEKDIKKKEEFLDDMVKELNKIEWLVKNILNIAKIDSKTLIPKREKVNVKELLNKSKTTFNAILELMNVSLVIDGKNDVYFVVDKKWTEEAINNLIKNAIEHKAKSINITFEKNNVYTVLVIKDDGEGIEEEDLPHIFERFYKAKNSKSESMGLGLAFVNSIITNENGSIRVKSKKGSGTKFTIKIYNMDI